LIGKPGVREGVRLDGLDVVGDGRIACGEEVEDFFAYFVGAGYMEG
jgi:hypothetical protein